MTSSFSITSSDRKPANAWRCLTLLALWLGAAGVLLSTKHALAQEAPAPAPQQPAAEEPPAPVTRLNGTLILNFQDATLDTILNYLSEEAGLIVLNDVKLDGRISVMARKPVTLDEAIEILNSALMEKGYTAIRRERLLRVVTLADAPKMRIPVKFGNDPAKMRETDTVITQVVPIQYAEAKGISENVQALINPKFGQITFNESSNSLIITDTEANIKRIVEIVQALDQSISQVTTVRVFKLEYADAEDTARLLEEVFEQNATSTSEAIGRAIQNRFRRFGPPGQQEEEESSGSQRNKVIASADERTNSVVVSAAPEVMETIVGILRDLDTDSTAKDSVLIYHVKHMEASDLADIFNDLFSETTSSSSRTDAENRTTQQGGTRGAQVRSAGGYTGAGGRNTNTGGRGGNNNNNDSAELAAENADLVGQVTAVANEATNTVLVRTQEKNFSQIEQILTELDRATPQVLIRVLVSEVTYDDSLDLGAEFQAINIGTDIDGDEDTVFTDFNLFESTLGLNYLLLDSTNFRLAIRALQGTGKFDVLSRPYLLTADNQEASISVGQRVPFPIGTQTTDTGNTTTEIDYEDVGIILTVTPQINDDGLVVLNIQQELSALTEDSIPINENLDAIILNSRTVTTQVAVANAQTVVIGGLMQDELQETVNKVPLLGDIPLIGHLFKRTQRSKVKTELLVFLTPEVINNPADLSRTSQRIRDEAEESMQNAVEPGLLKKHLERMEATSGAEADKSIVEPEQPVDPEAKPDALEGNEQ